MQLNFLRIQGQESGYYETFSYVIRKFYSLVEAPHGFSRGAQHGRAGGSSVPKVGGGL